MSRNARRFAAATIAAAATLALAGCGPSTSSSGEESGAAVDFGSVKPATEISFWSNHPGNSLDLEQSFADAFEKETGIKVDIVSAGKNYAEVMQKYQTAQVGGDAGDLVVVADNTWFSAYLNGSIRPVDDVFAAGDLDTSTYYQSLYDEYKYEGSHYAVPYARSVLLYYYNPEYFAQAGVTEVPKTWDEVADAAKKIQAAHIDTIPFAWSPDTATSSWSFSSFLWANGGQWSDEWNLDTMTDDATVSAMQWAQDSVKEGWGGVFSGDASTVYASGSVAQMLNSSGALGGVRESASFDIAAAPVPTGSANSDDVVVSGGAGVAINANTTPEKQLAAAMFASFLTNAENTVEFSKATGYLPARTDADTAALVENEPLFQVALDSMKHIHPQSYARVMLPDGGVLLDEGIMSIMVDGADVKSTLESMKEKAATSYDTNVKPSGN